MAISKRKAERQKHASNVIQNFLVAAQNTNDMKTAVLIFLQHTKYLQLHLKGYYKKVKARIHLMKLFWDSAEASVARHMLMLARQNTENDKHKLLSKLDPKLLKYALATLSNDDGSKNTKITIPKVPEHIKMKIIWKWYDQFRVKQLCVNQGNLKEYNKIKPIRYSDQDIKSIFYGKDTSIKDIVKKYTEKKPFKYERLLVLKSIKELPYKSIIKQCIVQQQEKALQKAAEAAAL